MAKEGDHVHRLVRSMTRQEKRYFKLYAARHAVNGTAQQCALFDVIGGMDSYDEAVIHKRFEGAAFLRRFTVTKHRLYDTILASLEAYHANSSVDARARRMLHQVELLHQRGLHADAARMLRGVRTLAEQHGRAHLLLDVVDQERRAFERGNYEGVTEADLEALAQRHSDVLLGLTGIAELWRLKSRVFIELYRSGKARSNDRTRALETLANDPRLRDGSEPVEPKARFMYHHIRGAIAFALNDLTGCEHHLRANEALLTSAPDHFKDEPQVRLGVLGNLAFVHLRLGRVEEALADVRTFKRIPAEWPLPASAELERQVFAMGAGLELTILCRTGRFERAMEKLPAIEEGLLRYGPDLSAMRKAGIRFQAAWACFCAARPEEARRWMRELLNAPGLDQHQETHALARVLELIMLVESGREDLLRYVVRNVDRFLRAHGRDHGVERALLSYAKQHLSPTYKTRSGEIHLALVEALTQLESDPHEAAAFEHFDPLCYAMAKAFGKPMSQVAAERLAMAVKKEATEKRAAA